MADIRKNQNVLDAFDYGASGDYFTNIPAADALWGAHAPGGLGAPLFYDTDHAGYARCGSGPAGGGQTRSFGYWKALTLDGDDAEVWAHEIGGTGSGKSWRLGLTKSDVFAGTSGYTFTVSVGTGGGSWFIRKYTADVNGTIIANGSGAAPTANPGWMLLRRNGTSVEAWRAGSGGSDLNNWSLIASVVDTSYTTGLRPTLWLADDAVQGHGYDYFGGGPAQPIIPQIVRHNPTRKLWIP